MKCIACFGQCANGKDVICDYLQIMLNEKNNFGDWKRTAFANAVKEVYQSTFNVDRDFIEKWKRENDAPPGMLKNVRQSLQFIGDGFRSIKSNIWIEIALRGEDNLIISDGRYINEVEAVKEKKGFTILVWRPDFENVDPNPSESQIKPVVDWCLATNQNGFIVDKTRYDAPNEIVYYDYFFKNDGTIKDLHNKIDKYLLPALEKYFNLENLTKDELC